MMRKRFRILLINFKLFFIKFFHQLRLLLWKSFLIKKRSPFVFLFELCLPLVLFLIMVAIRKKQYARPYDIQFFDAWPLPSAGFIPLMQGFCSKKNGIKNENGYYEYPNSTAREMMQQIEKINSNNLFDLNILEEIIKNDAIHVLPSNSNTSSTHSSRGREKRDDDISSSSNLVKNLFYLQTSIHELSKLSDYFPNNLCSKRYNNQTNDYEYDYTNNHSTSTTTGGSASLFNSKLDSSLRVSLMKNSGFIGLWLNMQKTFCGSKGGGGSTATTTTTSTTTTTTTSTSNKTTEEEAADPGDDILNTLNLTDEQFKSMSLLFHLLYSNPMIFYAPNGTVIKNLIQKSNQTFMLLEQINEFSRDWLEKSPKIVKYLQENETREKIERLNELKDELSVLSDEYKTMPSLNVDNLINDINIINSISCSWLYLMSGVNLNIFKGFSDESDLVNYFLNDAYNNNQTVIASIVFTNVNENSTSLPHYLRYKIRQNASFTQTTKKIRDRYWFPSARSWNYFYYIFGFVWLQDLIDRSVIDTHTNRTVLEPGLYVHQFPYPCYLSDDFLQVIEHVMPLCLAISFIYTVSMISQTIVYEKELRLKEVMKIMGLYNSTHWLAWFITYFIQLTFIMVLITLVLHYGKILMHSDPFLIFLLLELYAVATILLSFFISVWYSKAKLAAACAGIVYFLSYVPCMYITIREDVAVEVIPTWVKLGASLFSTSAFGMLCKYIAFYENVGTGLHRYNIDKSPLEDDSFTCLLAVKCMIVDCFLYIFLTWYVEMINPGYGLPKKWYFIFQYSYWFGENEGGGSGRAGAKKQCNGFFRRIFSKKTQKISFTDCDQAKFLRLPNTRRHLFESEPLNLNIGVQVKNLTKIYSNKKVAVNNLSINFYENQITSFLGHNGAGKSTTMGVLTGLMPATDGSAFIYGKDIRTHINQIRCNLGYVPQHNILFDKLTVEEHLWFYAKLKEVSDDVIKKLIDNMLTDTGLRKKRHNLVHTLSGGMQRKLSVAIAFVGDANVVLLDEPTAGVDPYARRAIWDLLLKYKYGRTIILSTHHMDEAELLGDRIAIISNGLLQCCGTSLFLKNVLGEGNHLTIVKRQVIANTVDNDDELLDISGEPANASNNATTMNSIQQTSRLINFVQQYIPSAFLKEETLREYHFVIPLHERSNRKFWFLFNELEKNALNLNISSYGMHDVSLEEVFLKAAQLDHETEAANETVTANEDVVIGDAEKDRKSCWSGVKRYFSSKKGKRSERLMSGADDTDDEKTSVENIDYVYEDLEHGWRLMLKQFLAIIIKRYLYNERNWKSLITQIILPACFICVAMTVALSAPGFQDLPSLELSSSQFYPLTKPEGTYVPFSYYLRTPDELEQSRREEFSATTEEIVETLRFLVGLGPTCTLNNDSVNLRDLFDNKTRQLKPEFFGYDEVCRMVFNKDTDIDWDNFVLKEKSYKIHSNNTSLNDNKPFYPKCKCLADNSGFECSDETTFNYPPAFSTIGHETLYNISETSINETLYYLYTTDLYRLKRYGALSFDNEIIKSKLNSSVTSAHFTNTHKTFKIGQYDILAKFNTRRLASIWYNHKAFHAMPIYLNTMNNALLRANMRHVLNDSDEKESLLQSNKYGISTVNHPMNHTNNYLSTEYILQGSDVIISIFTIVAMSFVPASFVLFLVYERGNKSLHLQFLNGLNPLLYWITNFLWDLFNYMLPASCVIIILKLFDVPAYVEGSNFPAVISLFLLYGFSISPLMYPASFLFQEPSNAYIFLIVINLFTGITCVVSSFLFQVFAMNSPDLNVIYQILKTVYLIFPPYCLGRGLIDIAYNDYYNIFYSKTGQADKMRSPFDWDVCSRNLVSMAVVGTLSCIFTLLLEYDFFNLKSYKNCFKFKSRAKSEEEGKDDGHDEAADEETVVDQNEDVDVKQERLRVLNNLKANYYPDHLIVKNLKKIYNAKSTRFAGLRKFFNKLFCRKARNSRNKQLTAVHNLCFGVPRGECFGLLGVNGAGKTTSFKMLTTDLEQTRGQISVAESDKNIRNKKTLLNSILNKRAYWKHIGYCPQFDALYDELTPADHLRLFARLKGIKTKYEAIVVKNLMKRLDLLQYADKPVGSLSLGNKRKLSTALALVGNPSIVYLDEPTSGMDPMSRRRLWECIMDLTRNKNQSVLLTSHSMEECEILCTRIAIMVDGKFKCLGSVQHLKTRFGDGYTLTVKIRETPNTEQEHQLSSLDYLCDDSLASSMNSSLNSSTSSSAQVQRILNSNKYISLIYNELLKNISDKCKLKERHFNNVYQFELPCTYSENLNLGEIYRLVELNKLRFNIIDYSLTQNTLDNVFINFIKEHTDKKNLVKNQLMLINAADGANINDDDDDNDDSMLIDQTTATQSTTFKFPIHDNDEQLLLSSSCSLQQIAASGESIDVIKSVSSSSNNNNNNNNGTLNSSNFSNNLGYKLIENMEMYEEDYC